MSLSEHIADFVVGYTHEEEPSESQTELLHTLKLSWLDWCAVALAGISEPVSCVVREQALADSGVEHCNVFGTSQKLPMKVAALVNGTVSHALDYDDTHFAHVGHTSVVVFSSVLSIAQAQGSSGRELLDAAFIGSEVTCHVGAWLGRSHYQAGFHQTATAGTFGATAAACRLLKLNHRQVRHALGLAATRASGLTSQFGTMSKPYHAGMAASNGVEVALLAGRGFTANIDGIECSRGFAETHHVEQEDAEPARALSGGPYVFNAVQHKFHACCHGLHASVEALQYLKDTQGLQASDVNSITVKTNPRWLKVCNVAEPASALESKFSYKHLCALVFSDYDTSALDTYSDERCMDESLQRIRSLTDVEADDAIPDTASQVVVQCADGSVYEARYDLADILPMQTREQRVLAKACVLLGEQKTARIWSFINNMDMALAPDLERLFD